MEKYFTGKFFHLFLIFLVFFKISGFLYFAYISSGNIFGGGSDAVYYHAYATGDTDFSVNYWSVILRFFNEIGLYNRDGWKFLIFLMSVIPLPYFFYKVVQDKNFNIALVRRASVFIVLFYPTVFFFTFDIYRDVFMYTVFAFSLLFVRKFFEKKMILSWFNLLVFLGLSYFLFLLRPYLGASLILALVVYFFYSRYSKYVKMTIFLYALFLMLVKLSGVLSPVLEYRGEDGFTGGGATLGIGLLNQNPVFFLILYMYSFFAQVFGFFFVNISSVIVFITESLPFMFAFYYVLKNIRFITKFGKYLIVFFIIYTTIWVMGNDNLGTAVRLRVPSYLAIFACMFIIYQEKIKYFYFQTQQGSHI